jgi:hypothetical protein
MPINKGFGILVKSKILPRCQYKNKQGKSFSPVILGVLSEKQWSLTYFMFTGQQKPASLARKN